MCVLYVYIIYGNLLDIKSNKNQDFSAIVKTDMKNKTSIFPQERHIFYALLRAVIQFQINNGMFENHNKFKRGEWLKYNWKAKIMIDPAIKDRLYPMQFEKYIIKYWP